MKDPSGGDSGKKHAERHMTTDGRAFWFLDAAAGGGVRVCVCADFSSAIKFCSIIFFLCALFERSLKN